MLFSIEVAPIYIPTNGIGGFPFPNEVIYKGASTENLMMGPITEDQVI